jgi:hypothetical protein
VNLHGAFATHLILRGQGVEDLQMLSIRLFWPPFMDVAEKVNPMANVAILEVPSDFQQVLIPIDSIMKAWT